MVTASIPKAQVTHKVTDCFIPTIIPHFFAFGKPTFLKIEQKLTLSIEKFEKAD
jgi:hypothetical protein